MMPTQPVPIGFVAYIKQSAHWELDWDCAASTREGALLKVAEKYLTERDWLFLEATTNEDKLIRVMRRRGWRTLRLYDIHSFKEVF